MCRARVYGIFEQLLDRRCRALYHLTGGDSGWLSHLGAVLSCRS
jgi:hypothetical protein